MNRAILGFFASTSGIPTLRWDVSASAGVQDGTGTWDAATTSNFTADGGATRRVWISGAKMQLGGGASGTAGAITVSGTVTASEIVSNAPFAGAYSTTGGTIALVGAAKVTANAALSIGSVVSGSRGLTKAGSATLTVSGANTCTGTTTVSAGTLTSTAYNSTSGASGLGAATNSIVVASGATLELAATGGRTTLMGNISGGGTVLRNIATTQSILLGGDNSAFTGTFNKTVVSRSMNFVSDTAGSASAAWILNSDETGGPFNAFRYGTTVADAWVPGLTSGSHTFYFGSLSASTGATAQLANYTSDASQTANTTIEVGALGTNDTFGIAIANTCAGSTAFTSSVVNVRKVGSGTWTLSGANTYTGTTAINGGALYIAGSLGATAITVANTAGCRIGVGSAATKTATTSSLTMAGANAAIDVHTNGTTTASRLNVTGAFAAGGCAVNILGALNIGSYILVSAGSSSGTLPVLGTNSSGNASNKISFTLVAGVLTMTIIA